MAVTYNNGAVSAVSRPLDEKLGDFASAKDFTSIQAAIDHVALTGGTVWVPRGVYDIDATLQLHEHVSLCGVGPSPNAYSPDLDTVTLRAVGSVQTMLDMYTAVGDRRSSSVHGICFDGNGIAERGIDISDTVSAVIRGNTFKGFTDGGAAIWGGGALFTTIELNSFSGPFYALDSQDSYSANAGTIYYGINVGDFDKNVVSAHYGVRFEGILNFTNNDFELVIKGRAALDINSASHNSYCNVTGNYFELSVNGGELCAIRAEKITGCIHDNRIYGDPGLGTAIKLDNSYNFALDIRGNHLQYWSVGIAAKVPGNGNANVDRINIGPNNFSLVDTHVTGGPGAALFITSAANNSDNAQPSQYMQGIEHHSFSGGTYHGSVKYGLVSEISLRKGNAFKFTMAGAVTVDTVRHTEPGQRFSVMAKFEDSITLANSAFNLSCGTDFVLPANVAFLFETDPEGAVREVGRLSALISTVAAPSAPDTVAGWVEIAPGKKVPFYQ